MNRTSLKRLVAAFASVVSVSLNAATASFAEFDARARAGERLNVVYFGASLTFSANATDPSVTGFRGLMSEYLERRYPNAHFSFHDAAIGGTTSKLGLFRMKRDVLAKNPDLVFLDFVCNDGGDNVNADNSCAYEQILRTLIGEGVPVEQVLFTFKRWVGANAPYEKTVPRHRLYRELASYYGTPCADAAKLISAKLAAKETTLEEIWPIDGGHPGDYGYSLFFEAAKAAFEQAVSEKSVCKVPSDPLYGSVDGVSRIPLFMFVEQQPPGWSSDHSFRLSMWYDGLPSRWLGDKVTRIDAQAESVGISVRGNVFAFFGEADGKTALPLEVTIDGGKPKKVNFSHGCDGRLFVFRELFADGWKNGVGGEHILSIKPIPDPKKPKGEVRIESVMSGTFRPTALALEIAKSGAGKDFDLDSIDHARGKK